MRLSRYTVIFDACVLYPAPLRDILVELASTDLFRAKWTSEIHREWIDALLAKRADLERVALIRTSEFMNAAVLDCMVEGYDDLIAGLSLPDANDRHVLAAAIHSKCDAIITFNSKDFPKEATAKYDIEVLHPDDFLHFQYGLSDADVITSVQRIRKRLISPPISANDYLDRLELQGLSKIVAELRKFEKVL